MKKMSCFIGLIVLLMTIAATAQEDKAPTAELFGGYSYVHSNVGNIGSNTNGASAAFAINPNRWLGLVADFGGYSGSGVTTETYLFGPRFSYRLDGATAFAQVLFGGAHATNLGNAFAMTAGGGFDINFDPHWSWRLIQAEYLMTRFNQGINNQQNNVRISGGIVYSWGN